VTDTLVADINRTGLHTLETPDTFETGGAFSIDLQNHGESTHVHLHLDDTLSEVARLEAGNHYVQGNAHRKVHVAVDGVEEATRGKLKVSTAYGAQTRYVDVVIDPFEGKQPVDVDPELSKPQQKAPQQSTFTDSLTTLSALPAVILGGVALILAIGAVVVPENNVLFAFLAILAGGLAGGYLVLR
jgi:hypothetical protein